MRCAGKTAIITGAAGSGMGRSIALTLAREGAGVVVNYLTSSDRAASVVAHIEKQGGRALAVQADITQRDQCVTLVETAVKAFGQVDICVIGPGGTGHWPVPSGDPPDGTAAASGVRQEPPSREAAQPRSGRRVADRGGRVARATRFSDGL